MSKVIKALIPVRAGSQRVKNKLNTNEKKDVSKNNIGRINKKKSINTKKGKPVNQNFDKIRKVLFHK